MSNINSNGPKNVKSKKISIRPIDVNPHESESDKEEEYMQQHIQSEINQAYEELQQIKKEKRSLLSQTNAEIETLKADWETKKQQYIEQAKQEGYAEGFEQGKADGLQQYKQLIADANEVVRAATKDYHSTIEQSDEIILDLAIHTAEKIIQQQLDEHPDMFMHLVQSAIRGIKDKSEIAIYLHPVNYDLVIRQKDELTHFDDRNVQVTIYANDELKEGSCLIEHPFGQIDASIDVQLQELREVLYEVSMESGQ
ncbi:flagellar assembly protein FliH [Lentibacillus halodurans]|uniref:flagellar assembly protein FliH n=1 Tax=Lentibacillus halodurans TaxID=237679 RepID=UPI00147BC66A|nr:flagellar assembly protein FliH [Lentibacillus halodurans]